ncbi:MAG: hypothetical protein ACK5PW_17325, partial [Burkholderiales bacterium]
MRHPVQGDCARTVRSIAPRGRLVLAALAACVALAACGERGAGAQPPGGAPAKGGPGGPAG